MKGVEFVVNDEGTKKAVQGRSNFETGGVAALRRGFQNCENSGLGQKMPF
jgi:hypothetical protein